MRYRLLSAKSLLLLTCFFSGLGVLLSILCIIGGINKDAFESSAIITFDTTSFRSALNTSNPESAAQISDWYSVHLTSVCHGSWTPESVNITDSQIKTKINDTMICDAKGLSWSFQLGNVIQGPSAASIPEFEDLNSFFSAPFKASAPLYLTSVALGIPALLAVFAASFHHGFGPLTHQTCVAGVVAQFLSCILCLAGSASLTSSQQALAKATHESITSFTSSAYTTLVWTAWISSLLAAIFGTLGQHKEKKMHQTAPIGTPVKIVSWETTVSSPKSEMGVMTARNTVFNAGPMKLWSRMKNSEQSKKDSDVEKGMGLGLDMTGSGTESSQESGQISEQSSVQKFPELSNSTSIAGPSNSSDVVPAVAVDSSSVESEPTESKPEAKAEEKPVAPEPEQKPLEKRTSSKSRKPSLTRPPPVVVLHGRTRGQSLSEIVAESQAAKARSEAYNRSRQSSTVEVASSRNRSRQSSAVDSTRGETKVTTGSRSSSSTRDGASDPDQPRQGDLKVEGSRGQKSYPPTSSSVRGRSRADSSISLSQPPKTRSRANSSISLSQPPTGRARSSSMVSQAPSLAPSQAISLTPGLTPGLTPNQIPGDEGQQSAVASEMKPRHSHAPSQSSLAPGVYVAASASHRRAGSTASFASNASGLAPTSGSFGARRYGV